MAGATFPRLKNWVAEILNHADLNAEIDNILTNLNPNGMNDYSNDAAQMQQTVAPFPASVISLATDLAGEITRLRYQIKAILGTNVTYWYSAPIVTLTDFSSFLTGSGLPRSRIISGNVFGGTAGTLNLLQPSADATKAILNVSSLSYYIQGTLYTPGGSNVNITGLSAGPTSNQTCLVNDHTLAAGGETKFLGMHGTTILVDTVGSEITNVAGLTKAFKISNGAASEYFIGEYRAGDTQVVPTGTTVTGSQSITSVTSVTGVQNGMSIAGAGIPSGSIILSFTSNTITISQLATASASTVPLTIGNEGPMISNCRRGIFLDYQGVNFPAITFSDNATITLCNMAWAFASTTGTVSVTYNTPTWSETAPTSPNIGDYWLDLTVNDWKVYSPGGWSLSNSIYVGNIVIEGTSVIAATSADVFKFYSTLNEMDLVLVTGSTSQVKQRNYGSRLSIYGQTIQYGYANRVWDTASLSFGDSVANNTTYYFYVDETGAPKTATHPPCDRRHDLGGYYLTPLSWRCVGYCLTNGSAQLMPTKLVSFYRTGEKSFFSNDTEQAGSIKTIYTDASSNDSIAPGWAKISSQTLSRGYYRQLRDIKNPQSLLSWAGTGDGTTTFSMPAIQAALVTDWITCTVTGTWISNTTYAGYVRRFGDSAEFNIIVTCSGAPTSTILDVTVPVTMDTAKNGGTQYNGGAAICFDTAVATYPGNCQAITTTTLRCFVSNVAGTFPTYANVTQAVPFTFGATDQVQLRFIVPVSNWGVLSALAAPASIMKVLK